MDDSTETILKQAVELGRLIRDTEIYRNYTSLSESLLADADSARLFDEYVNLVRTIKERQERADIIEKYEFENLESLGRIVSGNETIMMFLEAQKEYLDLLTRIQEELQNSDDISG
ncbi:MAG: YlbF family regulator [Spirochaetes bacterium]|nr:YlbF family regulator [Spirochaetota bacterium]